MPVPTKSSHLWLRGSKNDWISRFSWDWHCTSFKKTAVKRAFDTIYFAVHYNVILNDTIQSFQLSFELQIELEAKLLDQNLDELEN